MNRYIKLTAALAAFALLLVVMGLSTQGAVNAATGDITVTPKYVCSLPTCTTTNSVTIDVELGSGEVKITNLDVAIVPGGINPRIVALDTTTTPEADAYISVVQELAETALPSDANGTPGKPAANDQASPAQIRGFNGNRIQVEYKPVTSETFATYETITVDNVKPQLVTVSPSTPLIAKGAVDITFSADILDGVSGYTTTNTATSGISLLTDDPGILGTANGETDKGGVRLVAAGNVVALANTNFTAIDGGWNVRATISSSAIQSIGANTPWYFETRDRAGNTRRSSGSIELKDTNATNVTVTDTRFIGNLHGDTFDGSSIKASKGSMTRTVPIDSFANDSGLFTISGSWFLADAEMDGDETLIKPDDFEIVGTNLVTVDSQAPRLASGSAATTGVAYNATKKEDARGLSGKANSIKIDFDDDGKFGLTDTEGADNAGSGIDASSVTAAAFTVGNNTVSSALVVGNNVYLTLSDNLGPDEQPSIVIASGQIMDKAGNAFAGIRIPKATDGLGPNLSLSKDGDLSNERVTVTISTDEQLSKLPTVKLSRVGLTDGSLVHFDGLVCADDDDPPNLLVDVKLAANAAVGHECGDLVDPANAASTARVGIVIDDPRAPQGGELSASQTGAQAYTYAVTTSTAPGNGGKFNVYVTGVDTQNALNESKVGNETGANNVGAFTFQLDTVLNGGGDPVVKVGESSAVDADGAVPKVEAIDNLIVTVDFAGETGEYPGDSYRTVDLTLAELTITFKDGTTEKTTFNLTTDVNSPDSIQFTVALLNPKVGSYSLKVQATDSAGNASGTAGHVSRWEVVSAKPVPIKLQPGWNMISLPFQPGNPAINSVIPSKHPADIVMTFDGPTQTWLVSRRDAESGLFVGDIAVMTASTAYFVRTTNFQDLSILRPPIATNAAPPPQIPALQVVKGWNLIPIVSNDAVLPETIPADEYFGTLGNAGGAGWLKAITFNTLARSWEDVTPGEKVAVLDDDGNPTFDSDGDAILEPVTVKRGKGYWLYATGDGVIIP